MKTRALRSVTLLIDQKDAGQLDRLATAYKTSIGALAEASIGYYLGYITARLLRKNALQDAPWPQPEVGEDSDVKSVPFVPVHESPEEAW